MLTVDSQEMRDLRGLIAEMEAKIKARKWTEQAYKDILGRAELLVGEAHELLSPFIENAKAAWRSYP